MWRPLSYKILVYSPNQWDKGSVRGLGWSEDEKLLVVTEDGTVRCYFDLQSDFVPFTLGHVSFFLLRHCLELHRGSLTQAVQGAEEHGVISCRFWYHGFVA